jgi:hypothetical protein
MDINEGRRGNAKFAHTPPGKADDFSEEGTIQASPDFGFRNIKEEEVSDAEIKELAAKR